MLMASWSGSAFKFLFLRIFLGNFLGNFLGILWEDWEFWECQKREGRRKWKQKQNDDIHIIITLKVMSSDRKRERERERSGQDMSTVTRASHSMYQDCGYVSRSWMCIKIRMGNQKGCGLDTAVVPMKDVIRVR